MTNAQRMTNDEIRRRFSSFEIRHSLVIGISDFVISFPSIFLIRQVLQILLDLRAVLLRIFVIARLRDRIAIALRQRLVLAVAVFIFARQCSREAAALDAVAIAGALIRIIGSISLLV